MNISMDIFMNLTDMNTIIFSWIISADISVLLEFHEYEYGYALNIHEYLSILTAYPYSNFKSMDISADIIHEKMIVFISVRFMNTL